MELDKEKLLKLYPQYTSVLGPYNRPDGRKHVVLNNSNATKGEKSKTRTISYPKALVESNIGRRLLPNETIDHNDRDKNNDSENNLIIRDRSEHSSLDRAKVHVEQIHCSECNKLFTPSKAQRNKQTLKDGSEPAGPFCSKHCSGVYGVRVKNDGNKLERQEIVKNYLLPKK